MRRTLPHYTAVATFATLAACSLNPQPLPPGDTVRPGHDSGIPSGDQNQVNDGGFGSASDAQSPGKDDSDGGGPGGGSDGAAATPGDAGADAADGARGDASSEAGDAGPDADADTRD